MERTPAELAILDCGGLTPASRLEGQGTVVFDDMRRLPGLLAAVRGEHGAI
ncbi:hypothetical protein GCM10010420_02400 [Streptomyces glaucosporus]|uniref:Uncharacterized protein n=1 Tax=Streptomyces glaucosporus TaxID=284044 RepID=A0ABN3HN59_9ACTN